MNDTADKKRKTKEVKEGAPEEATEGAREGATEGAIERLVAALDLLEENLSAETASRAQEAKNSKNMEGRIQKLLAEKEESLRVSPRLVKSLDKAIEGLREVLHPPETPASETAAQDTPHAAESSPNPSL